MSKLIDYLISVTSRITIDTFGLPNILFELDKKIELNNKEIEERIDQLDDIKNKLIETANAVNQISTNSKQKKVELDELIKKYQEVKQDKDESEKLLQVNKDSFGRILLSTNKKTEKRSIVIGFIIGIVTGTLSSLLVFYLTSK
ncbi:MAG: hypothetical protein WC142_08290 [Bacteroidales bacterium]|jgi:hypothetical protein|nr:hypothetical protein [Bacteroidales bacterium]MDD3691586.1 hypothetical protein [Bacteroidales bacterium]MDD4581592.1 hypothetical protein [Bacteroidales bacterium]MDX9890238.1 hypothetical protein [Bacteroidales bacterium]